MTCGVGHRCGSDLELLWLWRRLAAVALTGPLAWEPLYATGVALKRQKTKQNKKQKQKNNVISLYGDMVTRGMNFRSKPSMASL